MRWEGQRQSDNVEDARGAGGGGGGLRLGGGSLGLGTIAVALVAGWLLGVNPLTLLSMLSGGGPVEQSEPAPARAPAAAGNDPSLQFVSVVLADTEDIWGEVFRENGRTYQEPKLVVYRGSYPTACGRGSAAMGPFYCPGDQKVYLDLGFFDTMRQQLGSPGDFAQAYVVAHEVGHHVQNLLGVTAKVDGMRGQLSERRMNALSVKVELQADCFAGVWAQRSQQSKQWLEQGDLEEALNAASQIGDDRLQQQAGRTVQPDAFTHGTSAQRVAWFRKGAESGSVKSCDTFSASQL
jgi:predicted metalloprotease